MADLDDLRKLLDEASVALNQAEVTRDAVEEGVEMTTELPAPAKKRAVGKTWEPLKATLPPMVNLTARLRVRLGPNDPITVSFDKARMSIEAILEATALYTFQTPGGRGQEHTIAKYNAADAEFRASSMAFVAAAVKRAGTLIK